MLEKTPTVSIIMPAFNRQHLISRSIQSVIRQTYVDWNLIVVDDRSTDDTVSVVQKCTSPIREYAVLRILIPKDHPAQADCGLEHADGKYIAYLDSDDEWEPFHLETMVRYLEKYPDQIDIMTANPLRKDMLTGEVYHYDELDLSKVDCESLDEGFLIDPESAFNQQLTGRAITTQAIVGTSKFLKQTKWNESISGPDDCLYNLELCARKPRICHLQSYHLIYWAHGENLTNSVGEKNFDQLEHLYGAFVKYYSHILDHFELNTVQEAKVKTELTQSLAWLLGYSVYEAQNRYSEARKCYRRAMFLKPSDWKLWKAYFLTWLKQNIRKCKPPIDATH